MFVLYLVMKNSNQDDTDDLDQDHDEEDNGVLQINIRQNA